MELFMDLQIVLLLRRQQSLRALHAEQELRAQKDWELTAMPWGIFTCRAEGGHRVRTTQHSHLLFPEWIFHLGAPSRNLPTLLSQWLWALQKLTLQWNKEGSIFIIKNNRNYSFPLGNRKSLLYFHLDCITISSFHLNYYCVVKISHLTES